MYTGTRLIFLLIIFSLFSFRNDTYRYPPDITLHIDFPELTETLFAKVQGREHPVRIGQGSRSDGRILFMENTGHAFPVEFHQVLREWMVKCRR